MSQSVFNIRHGQFHDISGRTQRRNDISYVSARVTLTGTWFQASFDLVDTVTAMSNETMAIVHPGEDAPWVLGRLRRLFGTQQIPEEERPEKSFFYASFLAVFHSDDHLAIPFECRDYYGKSALTFSTDDPPAEEIQERIAKDFWGLLLEEPTELEDYEDKMYHSGAGVWIHFGVKDGEPFMIEGD